MTRKRYIEKIQDALGDQKLIWVGTRGQDAIGLMDLAQFSEVYSVVAPLGAVSIDADVSLENLSKTRVDLDTYSIDEDHTSSAAEFRQRLLASLNEPTTVVSYRSLGLLSAISFPRSEFVSHLGMFHERQATFEHKPWVESELRKAGISVIPWRYFADEDRVLLQEELAAHGTLVLRANRTDGGAGLRIVRTAEEVENSIAEKHDGFMAAAPLLEPHVPLNVNGCIFQDGSVSVHPASVQLIGIGGCTNRDFGYCGNDFTAIGNLDYKTLSNLGSIVTMTGAWLWSQGYVGAFGIDAMLYENNLYLTEVNPRFQGSSAMSSRLDCEMNRPDIYLCHVAAYLGLPPPKEILSVRELVTMQPKCAQLILHNIEQTSQRMASSIDVNCGCQIQLLPEAEIAVLPDAILMQITFDQSVTQTGRALDNWTSNLVREMSAPTPITLQGAM